MKRNIKEEERTSNKREGSVPGLFKQCEFSQTIFLNTTPENVKNLSLISNLYQAILNVTSVYTLMHSSFSCF